MNAPAMEARALTKSYGDAPGVGPVDVAVARGEWVALVGHNGSGKTTLLRMVVGLLDPTSGDVSVGGHPAGSIDARAAASYIGDQPVFYDDLSLREHLEYVARLHDETSWEQRATDLLEVLQLTDRADDLPAAFSRGLRQKAAIALAFVRPFDILVVDEPFVGLDRAGREALLELLRRAHADGAALLVATHELTTVTAAERVIALRDGAIVFDGPAGDADPGELVVR